MNWLRVTKWKVATIFVVLIVALVVDIFNLNVFGYDITLHKGLDIVGGSELTIAICQGPNKPVDADPTCRSGPRNGISITQAQTDTIPVLQNRVNALGVSEASVQPVGSDQISIELPGVSLAKADSILGTTALIHFAAAASGAPPAAAAKSSDYCIQNPNDGFCVDQDDLFQPSQLSNGQLYPSGYHWKIDNNLPAGDIVSSALGTDSNGGPAVDITFNSAGGNEWNKITSAAYTVYNLSLIHIWSETSGFASPSRRRARSTCPRTTSSGRSSGAPAARTGSSWRRSATRATGPTAWP